MEMKHVENGSAAGDGRAAEPTSSDEQLSSSAIGTQLRALRTSRGLSLSQVAKGTEISKSFLSLLEAGRSDITIGRLMRLVEFFGISINDLIADPAAGQVVVSRSGEGRVLSSPSEGIEDFLLTRDVRRAMLPFVAVFTPDGANAEYSAHEGEEFGYVLSGSFVLDIQGQEPITLAAGDSVYFPASLPHAYRNGGDGESRLLCVVTPPHV
jgi:transcriptional regulator with XRE-family HTH domain